MQGGLSQVCREDSEVHRKGSGMEALCCLQEGSVRCAEGSLMCVGVLCVLGNGGFWGAE